ncbi:MAG: ABC transporter involved in cytochrome c biogenesis, CcmB subunit [Cytophagales bacterium]|jgi:heme exporter protein B|nr:heme exporter protein CcmB [Bacteroidota bacterium]MBS1982321.1 heme exporter protein CcmB [Bacteroidota bacterium]WHZ07579.1 MAG: ABC transporter involved in cytochrome c biogenesis, CcmB subunit [Cytophagales bacterium]
MNFILALLQKEFSLELKRKSVIAGLGLYLVSMVFIIYFSFALRQNLITPLVWSALFWITILFVAINTVAKSFIGEKRGLEIYFYSIASPLMILFSKMIYNFVLCLILSLTGYFLFILLLNNPVNDHLTFLLTLLLTSLGFATSLTLLSGIASKANNSNILMAVLSFPVVISVLLVAIKVTKNCMDDLDPSVSYRPLLTLLAIDALVSAVSFILFPFTWKN